jgi:hypothetical protein
MPYGRTRWRGVLSKAEAFELLDAAWELGIRAFDTAEAYGPFANEELVGEALAPVRDQVVIATKFGFDIDPVTGARGPGTNSQPAHIKAAVEASLKRLRTERIDLRVIAATNRDLRQMVADGKFQEDLFYRLNVIPIEIPPLRERREDIPALVDHFVQKHSHRTGRRIDKMEDLMGAKTIEGKASLLSLISHPDEITRLILEAAGQPS